MRNLVTAAIEAKCGVDSERDQTVDDESERPSGSGDEVCDGEGRGRLEGMGGMYSWGSWRGNERGGDDKEYE